MKRTILAILLLASSAHASQFIKQSTATEVSVKFVDATNGVDAETALTVTTFDCNLIKHADSGTTATALTVTASDGSNDASHLADGIYRLELSATDTNTIGRLDLYCQCAGAAPYEAHFIVATAEVYDAQVNDIASIDDNWEYPTASIGTAGGIGLQLKTNADVPISQYAPVRLRTAIATLASQTSFTLTDGSADNDAYNGWLIYVQDSTTAEQTAAGVVSDYVGSTKTITLLNDPAVFTMAAGDIAYLVPDRSLKALVDNRPLSVSAGNRAAVNLDDVSGALGTTEFDANFLTAGLINADAITDAKVAADVTIASVTGAVGSVGAGGITAATLAADTITAAKVAADVAPEIQTGLLTVPKNTEYSNFTFEMVDETDGKTLETGLTVTCQVSKDGAVLGACTNAVTEVGSGLYKTNVAAADLNADEVWLRFTATGARRLSFKMRTQK